MDPSQHPHQVRMWGFFIALRSAPLRHGTPLHAVAASLTKSAPYCVRRRSAISLSHSRGADASSGTGLPS
jgi:hypothetical protein